MFSKPSVCYGVCYFLGQANATPLPKQNTKYERHEKTLVNIQASLLILPSMEKSLSKNSSNQSIKSVKSLSVGSKVNRVESDDWKEGMLSCNLLQHTGRPASGVWPTFLWKSGIAVKVLLQRHHGDQFKCLEYLPPLALNFQCWDPTCTQDSPSMRSGRD